MSEDDIAETEKTHEGPNVRLLALSDGVIAVAITLLVLDIRLPDGFGEFDDARLWAALVAMWPRLFSYLLSFLVIASFWMSHRAKFNDIVRSDGRLMWINMLFLLTIGLVPFTTNLIAESGGTLSTIIYAAEMMLSGLSLALLWQYAIAAGLVDSRINKEDQRDHLRSTLLVTLVFAISIPLSVAHSDLAKYFWILIIPVNFLLRWLEVQRWKREHPGEPIPSRRERHGSRTGGPARAPDDR